MLIVKDLGKKQPYLRIWEDMKAFTINRSPECMDECWLLEHDPVYTQGQAGKPEHLLNPGSIPVIQTDRGGQVTYHGPGQLVAYLLVDLRLKNLGIRSFVSACEQTLIALLKDYAIAGSVRCQAPGVYVDNKKIASIGLRVKNGCTYHGIALNVSMDLAPFSNINPCGFSQLKMTQMRDFVPNLSMDAVKIQLAAHFQKTFGSA